MGRPKKTETNQVINDSVNHPAHYCQPGAIECFDEMIAVFGVDDVRTFCKLNVWKYRKRAMQKNGQEDLDKADWYMKKFIELTTPSKIDKYNELKLNNLKELSKENDLLKRLLSEKGSKCGS